MRVVFHTANNNGLAIKLVQNAANVAVQFFAKTFVAQKRTAVFRGKNRVNQNFCE